MRFNAFLLVVLAAFYGAAVVIGIRHQDWALAAIGSVLSVTCFVWGQKALLRASLLDHQRRLLEEAENDARRQPQGHQCRTVPSKGIYIANVRHEDVSREGRA